MPTGKLKRIVLTVAAIAGLSAASAGVLALRAYNEATKIDRSLPKAVVASYLDAEFVRRDAARAELFACDESVRLAAILDLRDSLRREETASGNRIVVSVGSMTDSANGTEVGAQLLINRGSGIEVRTSIQYWRFTMVDEDGWRVCGAEQLPDPSPSATPSATPPTAG